MLRALRHDRWEGGHTRHKGPIVTGDVAGAGPRQLVVDRQAVGVTCGEGHLVRVRVGARVRGRNRVRVRVRVRDRVSARVGRYLWSTRAYEGHPRRRHRDA